MEMSKADLGEFIAMFLHNLADNLDQAQVETFTPAQLREHADLIRLNELEREIESFFDS